MPVTVKQAGAHKPTKQPYVKVGSWRTAQKVYRKTGTWIEVWPLVPNPPRNAAISTSFNGSDIVVNTSWQAPTAGGHPYDRFIIQLVFVHPTTGAVSPQGTIGKTTAQFSHQFTNGTTGYQHLAGWKAYVQVWAGRNATATHLEYWSVVEESPIITVSQLPIPPAPTGLVADVNSCALTTTWSHAGSPALTGFQVEVWLSGSASTTYTVGATARSCGSYPWSAATVGRHTVNVRVRAMGSGGGSAWVTTSGMMPGPLTLTQAHYSGGTLYVLVDNNYDGLTAWRDYVGASSWTLQGNYPATSGAAYWFTDTASSGYARDNSTRRRLVFQPRNAANGWTGRTQGSVYVIKIPNPVFIQPNDTNTWWSIPIPGKWRTNPQAENWFYQGKSISGNSYGTLFYTTQIMTYFDDARLGYNPAITALAVYIKRTNVGGLIAAVNLNMWTHARDNDIYDAPPGLVSGPQVGPALARDQKAWVAMPVSWWSGLLSGAAKGITFYVDPSAADNQLRSEIGNVSNRYMILDKPQYGSHLDGRPPGTIRVTHNG